MFTSKHRLRYSRERALQNIFEFLQCFSAKRHFFAATIHCSPRPFRSSSSNACARKNKMRKREKKNTISPRKYMLFFPIYVRFSKRINKGVLAMRKCREAQRFPGRGRGLGGAGGRRRRHWPHRLDREPRQAERGVFGPGALRRLQDQTSQR